MNGGLRLSGLPSRCHVASARSSVLQFSRPPLHHCFHPRNLGLRCPLFSGLGLGVAIWFPVRSLWGFGWWDWFSHSSGSAIASRTQIPKAHSLAEALVFTFSLGLGSGKVRKTLEARASPVRLAWERMTLMSLSLRSHCKACFQTCFLSNSDFLSHIFERGVP